MTRYAELIAADAFTHLPVSHRHGLRAGSYRVAHRDPFDWMLAAQAEIEAVPLATLDPACAQFGIATV